MPVLVVCTSMHLFLLRGLKRGAARAPTWITSRLAAPARPTLTVTGSTSALSANALIFIGIVALNISVWRCPLKYDITCGAVQVLVLLVGNSMIY